MIDGGGGGGKGGLYLRLSAQFGEVGGGKGGGDEMEREKYKNKKRKHRHQQASGSLSFLHVLDWNQEELSWRRGICYRELEERINGCLG